MGVIDTEWNASYKLKRVEGKRGRNKVDESFKNLESWDQLLQTYVYLKVWNISTKNNMN